MPDSSCVTLPWFLLCRNKRRAELFIPKIRTDSTFVSLLRDLAPLGDSRISMTSTEASSGAVKECGDTTRKQKKVAFLTSSEYGQANVILAVAYEMLLLQQHEIHVASFSPLKARIKSLNELVPDNHVPAIFHTVFGPSALEALIAKDEFIGEPDLRRGDRALTAGIRSIPSRH
jgi:hypothetical protein